MLSTGNPQDPSCSSKLPVLRSNLRASSKRLASQEEKDRLVVEETTPPYFSIRDYVFASRSKGVGVSWPFAPQFLQLCLEHGVKDLLPPFEHPDIVRVKSLSKVAGSVQPAACPEPEQIAAHFDPLGPTDSAPSDGEPVSIQQESGLTLEELVVDCPVPAIHPSPKDGKSPVYGRFIANELINCDAGIASTVRRPQRAEAILCQISELAFSVSLSRSSSEAQLQPEVTDPRHKLEKLDEPLGKKNRLMVKLDTIMETSQAEDFVTSLSKVSHPMVSRVCPVCKTFSFTSNTTLNAHIDQCLSMRSKSKGVLSHKKVKPRKKRLIADIYATAPCCTLEDLDKRNGTNWASELAPMAAPANEVGAHTKRPELSPTDSRYNGNGAVYVDLNGIEFRILSKSGDQTLSRESFNRRKHAKDSKAIKSLLASKKKHFAPKHMKNVKSKAQRNRLIPFNMLKSQIQAAAKGDCDADKHQKKDKPSLHVSDSGDQDKSNESATIKQWALSRYSDILGKWTNKDKCSTLEDIVPISRDMLAMNVQPHLCNPSHDKTHLTKFSRSSEELTGSPKTKRVDFLYSSVHSMDEGERKPLEPPFPNSRLPSEITSSANVHSLKFSRLSGSSTCSSLKKLKETNMGTEDDCVSPSDRKKLSRSCSILVDQTNSNLKNNVSVMRPFRLEARKGRAIEKPSISKKLLKHRTVLRAGQKGAEILLSNNAGLCRTTDNICLHRAKTKKTIGSPQSYPPRSITMFGGEVINEVLPSRRNITEYVNIMEEQENIGFKNLLSGVQCNYTETETTSMQVDISDSGDYVTTSPMEKFVPDPIVYDAVNSEKTETTFSIQLDYCPCEKEHAQPISESEVHSEQLKQVSNKQEMLSSDEPSNEIGNQEIQMAEVQGTKDSCAFHPTECQVDTPSIEEPSGCLTNHGDGGPELPEKSSSTNSVGLPDVKILASEGELSASLMSIAPTISLPSSIDFKSQDSETELMARATRDRDNLHSATPHTESIESTQDKKFEKRKQEKKGSLSDKKSDCCPDGKHFCCSCRDNFSRESKLFRQNDTSRTSKSKQVSNLCIGRRNSSSNALVNSNTRPTYHSVSAKTSLDFSVKTPICGNVCSPRPSPRSQNHSTSSPILRLMGKNLRVVNHEELGQPQTTALDYTQQVNLSSNGYSLTNNHLEQEIFPHQPKSLSSVCPDFSPTLLVGDSQMPLDLPSIPVGGFALAQLQNGCAEKPDQQTQLRKLCKKFNSTHHMMDEVILIDNSCECETDLNAHLTSSTSTLPLTTSGLNSLPQR